MPVEFRDRPWSGVTARAADGYYLDDQGTKAQVIVVGPMLHTPLEIAEAVNETRCADLSLQAYRVAAVEALPPSDDAPPEIRQLVLERGFLAIYLLPYEVEPAQEAA